MHRLFSTCIVFRVHVVWFVCMLLCVCVIVVCCVCLLAVGLFFFWAGCSGGSYQGSTCSGPQQNIYCLCSVLLFRCVVLLRWRCCCFCVCCWLCVANLLLVVVVLVVIRVFARSLLAALDAKEVRPTSFPPAPFPPGNFSLTLCIAGSSGLFP